MEKKKDSKLSIWAAIFGFFTITSFIGFILAILDLFVYKNDNERHLGSYFAIISFVLCSIMLIFR